MKVKRMSFVVAVVFSIVCILSAVVQASEPPKYVFLFIGDGMGTAQRMAAEEFLKHQAKKVC